MVEEEQSIAGKKDISYQISAIRKREKKRFKSERV